MEALAEMLSTCIRQACEELPHEAGCSPTARISFFIPGTSLLASYGNLAAGEVGDVILLHCRRSAAGYALRKGFTVRAKQTWRNSVWADAAAAFPRSCGTICALPVPSRKSESLHTQPSAKATAVLTIAWHALLDKADAERWAAALAAALQKLADMEGECRAELAAEWCAFGWTAGPGQIPVSGEESPPRHCKSPPATDDDAVASAGSSMGASSSSGANVSEDSKLEKAPPAGNGDPLELTRTGLCFKDIDTEQKYSMYSADALIPTDTHIQLLFILLSVLCFAERHKPTVLGTWFHANSPWGYVHCTLQALYSGVLLVLVRYHRTWYCKHRETVILLRNFVLLGLSGCLTVPYSASYQADMATHFGFIAKGFMIILPVLQLIERIGMRIRFFTAHAIAAHIVFLGVCMLPVPCVCQFSGSGRLCISVMWAIHVLAMGIAPAAINICCEKRDRKAFIKMKQLDAHTAS